jgi:hypothetical protein
MGYRICNIRLNRRYEQLEINLNADVYPGTYTSKISLKELKNLNNDLNYIIPIMEERNKSEFYKQVDLW